MKNVKLALCLLALALCLSACGGKKVVARNCERAGNAEVYVCDPL